jgi:hypothetical protein
VQGAEFKSWYNQPLGERTRWTHPLRPFYHRKWLEKAMKRDDQIYLSFLNSSFSPPFMVLHFQATNRNNPSILNILTTRKHYLIEE